jgi:hypothetical protein
LRDCNSNSSSATAYFYFDYTTDIDIDTVLQALVDQLSACALSWKGKDSAQAGPIATLQSILKTFQNAYIILDALDQFSDRSGFLNILKQIRAWGLRNVHLLVTTRQGANIEDTLWGMATRHIKMDDVNAVQNDIQAFVSWTLAEDIRFGLCMAEEKELVQATLMQDEGLPGT